jgi:hypothetical protein
MAGFAGRLSRIGYLGDQLSRMRGCGFPGACARSRVNFFRFAVHNKTSQHHLYDRRRVPVMRHQSRVAFLYSCRHLLQGLGLGGFSQQLAASIGESAAAPAFGWLYFGTLQLWPDHARAKHFSQPCDRILDQSDPFCDCCVLRPESLQLALNPSHYLLYMLKRAAEGLRGRRMFGGAGGSCG